MTGNETNTVGLGTGARVLVQLQPWGTTQANQASQLVQYKHIVI